MIGPLTFPDTRTGGGAITFELCVAALKECPDMDVVVVSTTRKSSNRFGQLWELFWIMLKIWSKTPFCDVVFLFVATTNLHSSLRWIAPVVRVFGKRLIVKKLGGNPHDREVADHKKQAVTVFSSITLGF